MILVRAVSFGCGLAAPFIFDFQNACILSPAASVHYVYAFILFSLCFEPPKSSDSLLFTLTVTGKKV